MNRNFTAKHFVTLAKVIQAAKPAEPTGAEAAHMTRDHDNVLLGRKAMHEQMVQDLCELFKADNPIFNQTLFRQACGYEPGA